MFLKCMPSTLRLDQKEPCGAALMFNMTTGWLEGIQWGVYLLLLRGVRTGPQH